MIHKPVCALTVAMALLFSACGTGTSNQRAGTETPVFATATFAPTPTLNPTDTPLPPTPLPTTSPVEGMTTTQVNVRAETTTTSVVLGMILQPSRVEVIGKDASGTWYQLVYPESPQGKGWVLAAYVQVTAGAEVPIIPVGSSSETASVLVIQQVNVRSGPGTQFESLGTLNPNDVAALTGKDPGGAWLQIEFTSAPDGVGWVNTGFVQATGAESLPVIGETDQVSSTEAPPDSSAATATLLPAAQDGDSASAPSLSVTFLPAGTRALQYSGDVSSPQGDNEDWIQFTSYNGQVVIRLTCFGSETLKVELLQNDAVLPGNEFACGERDVILVKPNQTYLVHLWATSENELALTQYVLKIEQLLQ